MSEEAKSPLDSLTPLHISVPHPCPYLPNRESTSLFQLTKSLPPATYQRLMDSGFRRSGQMVYRPICTTCTECRPIRVPVATFEPSRSQWRAVKRNRHVDVEIDAPYPTDEKWRVYKAYLDFQHDESMAQDREDFERFLYRSPTTTLEMTYRLNGRVVGVGIVDLCPNCLSSVYFYFDPSEARRSLGVFSAVREIEECARRGLPYWYAGYFIRECQRMNYKAQYRPYELLGTDGVWKPAATSN